jgi:hypothetical protein
VADNKIVDSKTASPVRVAGPKAGSTRIPLAVLDHLADLHGAELKVLLVLSRNQARGGGRDQKPFSYSIPQIMKDTGLCPRAISLAISRLDKHHLILRVKKCGAIPSRYRVFMEPTATNKIPKATKAARRSRRPPEATAPPQKGTGRRRIDLDQPARYEQTILI